VTRRIASALAALMLLTVVMAVAGDWWLRRTTFDAPPAMPVPVSGLFDEPLVMTVTVSNGAQRGPWTTTDQELHGSAEMWKRMQLEDWNGVPPPLRNQALDNMLLHYRHVLNDPSAWDSMNAFDWDDVPQPVRTIAYRRMIAYWSGYYAVGAAFELDPGTVAETLEAIVMSESWFDHRARAMNRDGSWDVGLGQASEWARVRLRELHARELVDASLTEDEYYDPWRASRFVALWMQLMIEESGGDLDQAVRAYNRGIGDAGDSFGTDYLGAVQRRLTRYIRNGDAPASWDYVWRRGRALVQKGRDRDDRE
jgi:hypothetical protein